MSTIAFIGLGIMGSPMAVHLAKAGHHVVGYNRSPQRTAALVGGRRYRCRLHRQGGGGRRCRGRHGSDSPDVQAVLAGRAEYSTTHRPGALIIDFSSIRPDVTTALAAQAAETRLSI